MAGQAAPRPFAVIGENIHATRTLMRSGHHVRRDDAGGEVVAFTDVSGTSRTMSLAAPIVAGSELAAGTVKHVRNAPLLGRGGDFAAPVALTGSVSPETARDGRDHLVAAAWRQEAAGADYLDLTHLLDVRGDGPHEFSSVFRREGWSDGLFQVRRPQAHRGWYSGERGCPRSGGYANGRCGQTDGAFLCADTGAFLSGQVISPNGGQLI